MRQILWLGAALVAVVLITAPTFVPSAPPPAPAAAATSLRNADSARGRIGSTGLLRVPCAGTAALVSLCWIAGPRHAHGPARHRVPRV